MKAASRLVIATTAFLAFLGLFGVAEAAHPSMGANAWNSLSQRLHLQAQFLQSPEAVLRTEVIPGQEKALRGTGTDLIAVTVRAREGDVWHSGFLGKPDSRAFAFSTESFPRAPPKPVS